jgi:putative two-component system response regulator
VRSAVHEDWRGPVLGLACTMLGRRPKILLADDEPETLQLLVDVLEPDGYELFVAQDVAAAVQLALAHEPDLLLLDVMMPDGGGYAICEALRAQAPERELALIFLTALARPEELQDGFAAGAVDYIIKPFNTALLRSRVHTWLLRLAEEPASADPPPG